ncbi:MAG TPA: indole-3-glycerol phosphate synthase TrpC [Kiritimatiellia bacterium]|nr:indole-3-glycerol phosphate synthase TrpC [Kiritimatiellia bacterium]
MSILDEIADNKRAEIAKRSASCPIETLRGRGRGDFAAAMKAAGIGLVAEVKRKSPSAGLIRRPLVPSDVAAAYEKAGAQAVSVLLDEKYFGGGEGDFVEVRRAVSLPMLYKEFVVDEWQIRHAASLGASAVLLIAGILNAVEIEGFMACARDCGLDVLAEVHDAQEVDKIKPLQPAVVGINNRDLKTFKVDIETTFRLKDRLAGDALIISESGIRSASDVKRLHDNGIGGILVGEQLLRQPDIETAVKELMKEVRPCS